jgi:hypothetical protein
MRAKASCSAMSARECAVSKRINDITPNSTLGVAPMPEKMVITSISIPPALLDRLRELAAKNGRSVSALIVRAMNRRYPPRPPSNSSSTR